MLRRARVRYARRHQGRKTINEQPFLANLLNRLQLLFRRLSPAAQKLSQLSRDITAADHLSI
ncbi:hypothetical protein E0H54_26300 [Rhizobium leguminosarum bv. viciae]|nr:hypothetical protein CO654_19105 [Rhizobium sp. L18]TBY44392.1 hypothetical protein E0H54_26300 [Rhizobium leguminosarum bv. viciae]